MYLMDALKMAGIATAGAGALARDALGDFSGQSLPYRPQDVCRPETFNRLLREGAVAPWPQPPAVTAIERQDIPSISSNCHNLVLSLEQAGTAQLPDSVFVKLPMETRMTRWFMHIIRSWQLESYFSGHVAPTLPLRTPVTYATASRGTRFYLVQENLHSNPEVELFTNPDMASGPSMAIVRRCLDTFARLHASHAGLTAREREAILPRAFHVFLSPALAPVSRGLNQFALDPCLRRRPGIISPEVAAAYRESIAHWDALLGHWFSEPLTLLHGDSHLGNFFVCGDEMGMLDWQAPHWGKGIRDVQYFLIDSLPAATLAAAERDLVNYYVERRAVHGAPVDAAQTWEEYRSFTFHTLFTICVAVGFGTLNEEQDVLMTEILRRAVAAVERVDYAGWLRDFLR
tara:strand:+ start:51300 stop:52505 length:1206 start_codon:yes stop_codon:yes gene_type:complete